MAERKHPTGPPMTLGNKHETAAQGERQLGPSSIIFPPIAQGRMLVFHPPPP
jgi:hypothetical protein